MTSKLKIYFASNGYSYGRWIPDHTICKDLSKADLVLFEGGADINPAVYNEKANPRTSFYQERDKHEIEIYEQAKKLGKHMLGICRGAQLFCALQPKGRLVQHLEHPYRHTLNTFDGNKFEVNSIHHQLQFPFDMDKKHYKVLAWAESLSEFHLDGENREMLLPVEAEVVYYPLIKGLGIQSHPEMMPFYSDSNNWFRGLLTKLFDGTL